MVVFTRDVQLLPYHLAVGLSDPGEPGQGGDHHLVRDPGEPAPLYELEGHRGVQQERNETPWQLP